MPHIHTGQKIASNTGSRTPDPCTQDKMYGMRGKVLVYRTFCPLYGNPVYGDLVHKNPVLRIMEFQLSGIRGLVSSGRPVYGD